MQCTSAFCAYFKRCRDPPSPGAGASFLSWSSENMAALRVGSDMKVSGRNAVSADIVVGVSPGIAASTCTICDTAWTK